MDILKPFVPHQLAALETGAPRTMASVVAWDKRKITLDGSGAIANAVFLRLERDFDASTTLDDMARQLRSDELATFEIVGVKEDRA